MRILCSVILIILPLIVNAVNVFYYSPKDGKGGLRFAIENSDGHWKEIGDGFNFVSSDFGPWGSGKKMFNPFLTKNNEGWDLIFKVNPESSVYGITKSADLIHWKPQEYVNGNDLLIGKIAEAELVSKKVGHHKYEGRMIEMDEAMINNLKKYVKEKERLKVLYSEKTDSDFYRFKDLNNVKASLTVSSEEKEISPLLLGIFFEDINYAADGGLYGELIQNRDFEYKPGEGRDKKWGHDYSWYTSGRNIDMEIKEENPVSENNPHYARLIVKNNLKEGDSKSGIYNSGYDGISLRKGENYKLNLKARSNVEMPVTVDLVSEDRHPISIAEFIVSPGDDWTSYEALLTSDKDYSNARFRLEPTKEGVIDLDMVSLFPVNTFKGRENGLRPDLAQTLADLKPSFVRFPGGCVAHGNGIDNIYDWKGSIGPLEERKPLSNLWGYHQTRGLGYHEYFLFCEDIGAEPVPVLAAGVPCQNSSWPSCYTVDDLTKFGQQQGIPMDSMDNYIQNILDLIEYANGPVTSEWGAKRAQAGHPEPFNLKYIGIGNEDMITEVFKPRFSMIQKAVKEAYPEIIVIGTTGPFYEGSDYDEGWEFAKQEKVDMVDEHYYVEPAWLIYNQDFYDDYDRKGPKVYLGEWAAHLPDRSSTMETALAEALYITSLERNGDVVRMSSYAPLLAKKNHTQWRPDLIYFDNDSVYPTTDYHVMRLAAENAGDRYVNNKLDVKSDNEKVKARIGASVVKDSSTGDTFIKLVNLLPVTTDMEIDLSNLFKISENLPQTFTLTTMSGNPDKTEPEISTEEISLPDCNLELSLPAYSFSIIKL